MMCDLVFFLNDAVWEPKHFQATKSSCWEIFFGLSVSQIPFDSYRAISKQLGVVAGKLILFTVHDVTNRNELLSQLFA